MRDHEAELAAEAEAGGERAQRRFGMVSVATLLARSLPGRCLLHHRPFVGDEVGGGVQGRDPAEDRERRRETAAPQRRRRRAGRASSRCEPGRRERGNRAAPRAGHADRLQDAGDHLRRAVLVDIAQQLGVAVAAADGLGGDDDRRDHQDDRAPGRPARRESPSAAPTPRPRPPVHLNPSRGSRTAEARPR